ncbi:FcoT family thioesterase [Streptomyces sp. 4N509B]|uniref:FcoT family thioesterase n=1 Tax=Streptomyces sp. 4N509B TaxID=3457413 RepID=UPI003FD1DEB6
MAVTQESATLLDRVLRVYKPHCRYLRSANVLPGGEPLRAACDFEIPESCYIDDTGHFNSVEFNICYNQSLYWLLATSVRDRLLPVLSGWTMDDFWARQLPDIYIAAYEAVFHTPMRGRELFHGEIEVRRTRHRRPTAARPGVIWLDTAVRFWEQGGGQCDGRIRIAVTNLPREGDDQS